MTGCRRLGQAFAVLLIAFLVAYPARSFVLGPSPALFKVAWLGVLVAASARPAWAPWLLLVTVPLVPIVPYTWRVAPFAIVHLIVIALALPRLVRELRGRRRPDAPPDGLLLALIAFIVVALTSAIVKWGGFSPFFYAAGDYLAALHLHLSRYAIEQPGRGIMMAVPALTMFVDGLLAYLIVGEGLTPISARRLLAGLAGVAMVVAALGVAQAITGVGLQYWWQVYDPGIIRVSSTYADPNALAAFLALVLPLVGGLAASARMTRVRLAWLAGGLLVAGVLVLTGGRAGIAAAGIGIAVACGLGLWRGLNRDDPWPVVRRSLRGIALAVGVAGLALIVSLSAIGTALDVRHSDQNSYLDMALFTLNLRQPIADNLKGRLDIWRIAGLMVRDAPTFGVGIGQIHGTFAVYNRQVQAFEPDLRLSAHNTFLNVAAETGLVGLALWIVVLALVFRSAFRRGPPAEPAEVGWIRVGLAGGLLAFGLTMLTSDRTVLREDLVIFGSMAALASAWSAEARRSGALRPWLVVLVSALVLSTAPARIAAERRLLPMERIDFGLYTQEQDPSGEPFRWTSDRAAFHVPGDATTLSVPIRSLAPEAQTVRVRLDDAQVDEFVLRDHAWRTVRYVLPAGRDGRRYHRVDLLVSPTWQPPGDARALGVMLGDYRWER